MGHVGDGDISCNWSAWNDPQRLSKGTRRLGNKRTSGDHPGSNIIKIGQNSENSPSDLRRLIAVENHQLTLLGKLSKE